MSISSPTIDVITLLPDMFRALNYGVAARAWSDAVHLALWNPRDYSDDVRGYVDDRPYGGGPGMVMRAQPLWDTVAAIRQYRGSMGHVVVMSPIGRRFDQAIAANWVANKHLILVCGRYEGMDQRFIDQMADDQVSMGDFVCSGGELPSMTMLDSMVRLIPGVLGNDESAQQDSFAQAGMLDCPHYTRPQVVSGHAVPSVLLSGHEAEIASWREQASLVLTKRWRADLWPGKDPD